MLRRNIGFVMQSSKTCASITDALQPAQWLCPPQGTTVHNPKNSQINFRSPNSRPPSGYRPKLVPARQTVTITPRPSPYDVNRSLNRNCTLGASTIFHCSPSSLSS